MGDSKGWISAHVYYHGDMDALIRGVRPLVDELDELIDGFFFVRYWQGGPHLRLRLRPRAEVAEADVVKRVDEGVRDFLRANPSCAVITEADYLKVAEPLSRAERGTQTIEPLQPDNSLRYVSYAPETLRYGGTRESMAAVERNFADSSRIAFDVIAGWGTQDQRTGQALAMMAVCAAICDADLGDYFTAARGRFPELSFDKQYAGQRERLIPMVARLSDLAREGDADGGSAVERWLRSVRALRGRLDLDQDYLRSVLLSCSHMNNNRLGITLPEEAYLTYLLWRVSKEGER
jgi:thiopeptide-type bacteriocin biosynthesis protein